MPLFVWKCDKCGTVTRKLLPKRPVLSACEAINDRGQACFGTSSFVTNTSSQTMEVIDNGLMAKVLERPANIEEKLEERRALAEKPEDPIV